MANTTPSSLLQEDIKQVGVLEISLEKKEF